MEDLGRVLITEDTGRPLMMNGSVTPDYVISLVPEIWVETLAKKIVSEFLPYFPAAGSGFATPAPTPYSYFPSAAQPSPVAQMPGPPFGLILLMDVVPEHVVKTFQLVERGSGVGYKSDLYSVFMEGESLDTTLRKWLIVYTNHEYHAKRASELDRQLRDLIVDGVVVSLPVVG